MEDNHNHHHQQNNFNSYPSAQSYSGLHSQPHPHHRPVSPATYHRAGYRYPHPTPAKAFYSSMSPSSSPSSSSQGNKNNQVYSAQQSSSSAAAAAAAAAVDAGHARAYRSRKDRPCDSCRKRKSRCIIEEAGQNCQSCRTSGKDCTFEISPTPRSRPVKNEREVDEPSRKRSHSLMSQQNQLLLSCANPAPVHPATDSRTSKPKDEDEDRRTFIVQPSTASVERLHGLVSTIMYGQDEEPDGYSKTPSEEPDPNRRVPEEERGMMPVVLGSSSSEDPQLLRQANSPSAPQRRGSAQSPSELLSTSSKSSMPPPPNPEGSSQTNRAEPLQVRQVTRDPHRPIFFAFVPSHPYGRSKGKGKEIGAQGLARLRTALTDKIGPLMAFYSLRDAAAFPLLMESQRRRYRKVAAEACRVGNASPDIPLPAVLAAATLATATVYDVTLRPISKQAWGANLHALTEQFDLSTLVTLQVALTDLTGRPSINTSGNFMSFSQTLAISHMLGLHLDPTNWILPREEKDVRIRLWWAIVIHDKWSSLCWGRPSIIHEQDYSTPLPRRNSLSPCREHLEDHDLQSYHFDASWQVHCDEETHTPGDTFAGLCRLTLILSDILAEFHSIRSSTLVSRDAFAVAQKVKSYLVILEDWKVLLPQTLCAILRGDRHVSKGAERVPGTRSLQLSYLGVNLLLCRTALDAVTTKGAQEASRLMPAHKTALHGTLMVVEYLETLTADDYNGFFLHYGAHHLASCLSLLARLSFGFSHIGDEELLSSSILTMQRLLIVLSQAHRLYNWDLAELALTRSRTILPTLEARIPEFPHFFPAEMESNESREGGSDQARVYHLVASAPSKQGAPPTAHSNRETTHLRRESMPGSLHAKSAPDLYSGNSMHGGFYPSAVRPHDNADSVHHTARPVFPNGAGTVGPSGGATGLFSINAGYNGATIPIDAVGLPYPFGMSSHDTVQGSHASSHLLSGMEVDWLGMGLQPQVYPDWVPKVDSTGA